MRIHANILFAVFIALCSSLAATMADDKLQSIPIAGTATKLSSVTYFDPPNERQIKMRLSGAELTPLESSAFEYDVKKLTVQQYSVDGKLQAVIEAPECTFAQLDGVASSPGHFVLKLADDKVHVEGDGFLWRQKEQSLIISNHVQTIIQVGTWKVPTL